MRERSRSDNCRVLDADVVVRLIPLAQAAKNRNRILDIGLADVDDLEAPLQRCVFLDVLAVLVQRGCANRPQFAARQGRLHHIAGIDRALSSACAHQGVQLVDEEDDLSIRLIDLLQHSLEPVLELASELCPGQHGPQVQRNYPLIPQQVGHVARNNAPGEALDNGCFAYAWLADQHRIVLRPPAQHLDHAANLLVASNHRVELAAPGQLSQVLGVFFERLELGFGVLIGDTRGPAHRGQRLQNRVVRRALGQQRIDCRVALFAGQAQQQMLGRDVLVLEVSRFLERLFDGFVEPVRQARLALRTRNSRQFLLDRVQLGFQPLHGNANFFEHRQNHALAVCDQAQQQMHRLQLRIAQLRGLRDCLLHCLLRLDGQFVPANSHNSIFPRSLLDSETLSAGAGG